MESVAESMRTSQRIENLINRLISMRGGHPIDVIQHLAMWAAAMKHWKAVGMALRYFIENGMSNRAQQVARYREGSRSELTHDERIDLVHNAGSVLDALKIAISQGVITNVANDVVRRAVEIGDSEVALKAVRYRKDRALTTEEKCSLVKALLPKTGGKGDFRTRVVEVARQFKLLPEFRDRILRVATERGCVGPAIEAVMLNPENPVEGIDLNSAETDGLLTALEKRCSKWERE